MNKAMALATGQYLIFLNSGDAFTASIPSSILPGLSPTTIFRHRIWPDLCGRLVATLSCPRHLVAPEELTLDSFAEGMVVCHQAFVVLRKIAQPYNLKYRFSADYEWCIRCLQRSRSNVALPDNEGDD